MALSWKAGGLLLGIVFFAAVLLVKPIGVSTQFVVADGLLWSTVDANAVTQTAEGWTSTSAYLSKYAKNIAEPLNYSLVFVIALMVGAGLSSWLRQGVNVSERTAPALWRVNFGDSTVQRYLVTFLGGFVVLYGARLAGGCTSGHMMSGLMQTATSGYVFTLAAFAAAIPTAMLLYRSEA